MSNYWATADRVTDAISLQLGAGTTPAVYAPGKPIDVKRIVLVMTTAQATSAATVTVAVRNVDDSSSTTIGTFVTPAVMALNAVFKVDIAGVDADAVTPTGEHSQVADVTLGRVDGYFTNLPGVIEVNPGQEISLTSDGGGDTGVANAYFEYSEQGNNPERFEPTAITFTYA